jgi:hypothetical protein
MIRSKLERKIFRHRGTLKSKAIRYAFVCHFYCEKKETIIFLIGESQTKTMKTNCF